MLRCQITLFHSSSRRGIHTYIILQFAHPQGPREPKRAQEIPSEPNRSHRARESPRESPMVPKEPERAQENLMRPNGEACFQFPHILLDSSFLACVAQAACKNEKCNAKLTLCVPFCFPGPSKLTLWGTEDQPTPSCTNHNHIQVLMIAQSL